MKVLHVGDIAFVGSHLAEEMRRRGIEADVLSKKKGTIELQEKQGLTHAKHFLDELNLCGKRLDDYDIIHGHYLLNWGSLGLRLKKTKTPVVLHCHGSDTRPQNGIDRWLARFIVGTNKFLLYSTPDLLDNISWFNGRTIYLPNPVQTVSTHVDSKSTLERILIYGTMYRLKRIEALFDQIKDLPYTFDMFAIGKDKNYLMKVAPKNVNFMAPIAHDEIPEKLSAYPLIIGASQDGSIRVSELESMAQGVPTLFPFVYNEYYPEALPMPQDWLSNLDKYIGDTTLGEKQRQWVEIYHGADVVVDQLLEIYKRVMAS